MNRNLKIYDALERRKVPRTAAVCLVSVPVAASANVVLDHLLGRYRRSRFYLSAGSEEI